MPKTKKDEDQTVHPLDISQNVTNYDDFISSLEQPSQTNVKIVSTPRMLTSARLMHQIETRQNSIQSIESKKVLVCCLPTHIFRSEKVGSCFYLCCFFFV